MAAGASLRAGVSKEEKKLARRRRQARVQKVIETWLCECWIVSIPIKYRNCSFRIVG